VLTLKVGKGLASLPRIFSSATEAAEVLEREGAGTAKPSNICKVAIKNAKLFTARFTYLGYLPRWKDEEFSTPTVTAAAPCQPVSLQCPLKRHVSVADIDGPRKPTDNSEPPPVKKKRRLAMSRIFKAIKQEQEEIEVVTPKMICLTTPRRTGIGGIDIDNRFLEPKRPAAATKQTTGFQLFTPPPVKSTGGLSRTSGAPHSVVTAIATAEIEADENTTSTTLPELDNLSKSWWDSDDDDTCNNDGVLRIGSKIKSIRNKSVAADNIDVLAKALFPSPFSAPQRLPEMPLPSSDQINGLARAQGSISATAATSVTPAGRMSGHPLEPTPEMAGREFSVGDGGQGEDILEGITAFTELKPAKFRGPLNFAPKQFLQSPLGPPRMAAATGDERFVVWRSPTWNIAKIPVTPSRFDGGNATKYASPKTPVSISWF
jgi:hypothetical protein